MYIVDWVFFVLFFQPETANSGASSDVIVPHHTFLITQVAMLVLVIPVYCAYNGDCGFICAKFYEDALMRGRLQWRSIVLGFYSNWVT